MTEAVLEDFAPGGTVTDAILAGRLILRQGRTGHRAGTDAVLLAAACGILDVDRFVDVGAGVGTVGLAVALRATRAQGVLLEADPATARLAALNCRLNGVDGRVRALAADLFDPGTFAALGGEKAALVVSNPPFFLEGQVRPPRERRRARAYTLPAAALDHGDWLRAAVALLAPKGRYCTIHRPEALPSLLEACGGRLGSVAITPVHARAGQPAIRMILTGVKGSRGPLSIRQGFVLHEADGRFTPEADAVHRGEAMLSR